MIDMTKLIDDIYDAIYLNRDDWSWIKDTRDRLSHKYTLDGDTLDALATSIHTAWCDGFTSCYDDEHF